MTATRLARRAGLALVGLTLSAVLGAAPALAQGGGGGGGGGTTPPPSVPPVSVCPEYAAVGSGTYPDGTNWFTNEYPGVGCLVARIDQVGTLSIGEIATGAGWTSKIKSAGGGTSNKIDIEFSNASVKDKHSILVQPGKTVIR